MHKTVTVAIAALVVIGGLSACSSTTINDPAPIKAPSVTDYLAKHKDAAPSFTDLTQKPFEADGVGDTTIPFTVKPGTKSISVFVACATSSKYGFKVYAGKDEFEAGTGEDCLGANLASYGRNLDGVMPTSIKVDVKTGTHFEVTVYESTEVIPDN